MPAAHPQYLTHVDGLRAIAVLAVVLYHFFPSAITGGFVGVDIFFVISGFLITRIITGELDAGNFSLPTFYSRRIRRIVPALMFTLALSAVAGALILASQDYLQFARTARNAILFISNFTFQRTVNYFERGFDDAPMLHTWSLSVEQQFYLLWPLLLMAMWRFGSKKTTLMLGLVSVASLGFCQYTLLHDATMAFYSPLTRLWEFAIGGAMVGWRIAPERTQLANRASLIGMVLLLAPIFYYSDATIFPGLSALAPCLGTALVIAGGRSHTHFIQRMLSVAPMRFIGGMSYSLYLAHWPLLCFYKLYTGERQLSFEAGAMLFAISFCIAWFSWKVVERPFRKPRVVTGTWKARMPRAGSYPVYSTFIALALCIGVTEMWFSSVKEDRGWRWRFAQTADLAVFDRPYRYPCFFDYVDYKNPAAVDAFFKNDVCVSGDRQHVDALLLGDSHAMHYDMAITAWNQERGHNLRVLAAPGCPVLLTDFTRVIAAAGQVRLEGRGAIEHAERCGIFIKGLRHYIERERGNIKLVFIAQRYAGYAETAAQKGFVDANNMGYLTDVKDTSFTDENTRRVFAEHTRKTVEELLANGVEHITFLGQVPMYARDPANCYMQRFAPIKYLLGEAPARDYYCTRIERDYVQTRLSFANGIYQTLQARDPAMVSFIDVLPYFCDGKECSAEQAGHVIYNDSNHLNDYGARFLRSKLVPAAENRKP